MEYFIAIELKSGALRTLLKNIEYNNTKSLNHDYTFIRKIQYYLIIFFSFILYVSYKNIDFIMNFKENTALIGKLGKLVIDGELGWGSLSSLAAIACWSWSYFGPRRYLSRQRTTVCPVRRNTSTASWFE